jgi:hypothetical protein
MKLKGLAQTLKLTLVTSLTMIQKQLKEAQTKILTALKKVTLTLRKK